MLKIVNINLEKCAEIANQIEQYCREIAKDVNPHQIILFGLFATLGKKATFTIYFLGVFSFIIESVKNVVRGFSLVQDGKGKRARP